LGDNKIHKKRQKAVVVGGGAAGMMAAIALAERRYDVTLIEKNEKLGKKLFITGKGRCNFTNDCEPDVFFENVISNPCFLYSAYYGLTAQDLKAKFESWGLKTKVERGQRAFPASDHSYDVIDCLKRQLKGAGVTVLLNTCVTGIAAEPSPDNTPSAVGVMAGRRFFPADRVIVATGGLSYPSTGSDGDGLKWAEALGHTVTSLRPSLVAMTCAETDLAELQGLTLKNVTFTVTKASELSASLKEPGTGTVMPKAGKKAAKPLYSGFGEMMFTHFGVTGPLVLTASAVCGRYFESDSGTRLSSDRREPAGKADFPGKRELAGAIDLKPAVPSDQLDGNLIGLLKENANRDVIHAIRDLYPASLVAVILDRAGIASHKKAREITREERAAIVSVTKAFPVTLTGTRGFDEAIITQGGISVKEIDPATMESKLINNLYFAGEVLDVDALTGGFNLQIAWSTGYAAGSA